LDAPRRQAAVLSNQQLEHLFLVVAPELQPIQNRLLAIVGRDGILHATPTLVK
jgi:hypothetical protein